LGSDFAKTIAAVNRPVTAGFERYLGGLTALGAGYGEHLARSSVAATIAVTRSFPRLTAFRAALWLVRITLGLEELLLFGSEGKRGAAIGTLKGLVFKTHWMPSSLLNSVRVRVIQHLRKSVKVVSNKIVIT
jgi:hypothetical protein